MKVIYLGPSDYYTAGKTTLARNGEPGEIEQQVKKRAESRGHRFDVVQEPKAYSKVKEDNTNG